MASSCSALCCACVCCLPRPEQCMAGWPCGNVPVVCLLSAGASSAVPSCLQVGSKRCPVATAAGAGPAERGRAVQLLPRRHRPVAAGTCVASGPVCWQLPTAVAGQCASGSGEWGPAAGKVVQREGPSTGGVQPAASSLLCGSQGSGGLDTSVPGPGKGLQRPAAAAHAAQDSSSSVSSCSSHGWCPCCRAAGRRCRRWTRGPLSASS